MHEDVPTDAHDIQATYGSTQSRPPLRVKVNGAQGKAGQRWRRTCTSSSAWHSSSSSITASATVQESRTRGGCMGTASSPTSVSSALHSAQSCSAITLHKAGVSRQYTLKQGGRSSALESDRAELYTRQSEIALAKTSLHSAQRAERTARDSHCERVLTRASKTV